MRWLFTARRYDEATRVAALAAPYFHPRLSCSPVAVHRWIAEQMAEMTDEGTVNLARLAALAPTDRDE